MKMKIVHILILGAFLSGCVSGLQTSPSQKPASYHYQMGLSYIGERNFTSALVELTEAERLDPENHEVLYNLGIAYMGKKRFDLAEQKLVKAIMLKANYSVARNDLGVAYMELKRWDNAIQQFRIVKDDIFYDNTESATINLGLAYLGKGDYARSLEELRAVAAANPRNPAAHLSLGRVHFAMEKTDQAVAEYKKAIELYKEYASAHYYLGLAQMKMNDMKSARGSFSEVVRIAPDSELGRSSLGYLDLIK